MELARESGAVAAIDGKTICGSGNEKHRAYHVVSAFVAENQITLGEITVEEKSNEITAVPHLLDLIDVEGAIVTVDAMSCQKAIVEKIVECKAEYTIGLKLNQQALFNDVKDYFEEFDKEATATKTSEKGHGRIETRVYYLVTDISWLAQRNDWCGLKSVEDEFTFSVRKHWSIEFLYDSACFILRDLFCSLKSTETGSEAMRTLYFDSLIPNNSVTNNTGSDANRTTFLFLHPKSHACI